MQSIEDQNIHAPCMSPQSNAEKCTKRCYGRMDYPMLGHHITWSL